MPVRVEDVVVDTADGWPLKALRITPEDPVAAVLVAPGTGTTRQLYEPLGQHLARAGLHVLLLEYRGMGGSKVSAAGNGTRQDPPRYRDWGQRDIDAALANLQATGLPLGLVGHSAGGFLAGLTPRSTSLRGIVHLTSMTGWWRVMDRREWPKLIALWYAAGPALSALLGTFPASRFGLGEDLPGGVMREWARWCRRPGFLWDDPSIATHHADYTGPLLSVRAEDDLWGTEAAVEANLRHHTRARIERRAVPAQPGRRIGHFGLLRPGHEALWSDIAAWLHTALLAEPTRSPGTAGYPGDP